MGGKSTLMRQVCLASLMAQVGGCRSSYAWHMEGLVAHVGRHQLGGRGHRRLAGNGAGWQAGWQHRLAGTAGWLAGWLATRAAPPTPTPLGLCRWAPLCPPTLWS